MSLLKGRFHHCILLLVVLISLCQFNSAVYYSGKTSGKFPRQGKRTGQYISNVPEREMNYLRRRDLSIRALKRFYALLDKKQGLQNLDEAPSRLSSY